MPRAVSDLYRPLPETDEIRLLRLDRHTEKAISGVLETWSLKDAPPFYALSYVWGPPKKDARVLINGQPLAVTRSLEVALIQLSRSDCVVRSLTSEYVWIDQICINQQNDGERRHQVTLMGPIYNKALRTIVWLGEDLNSVAESAFGFCGQLEELYRKERKFMENGYEYVDTSLFRYTKLREFGLPSFDDDRWTNLEALYARPWFSRLWVQQEAILSKQDPLMLFGSSSSSFTSLGRAYAWLKAHDFQYYTNSIGVSQAENVGILFETMQLRRCGLNKDLSAMIVQTSSTTHATDPRDKVYGVLGIAENGLQRNKTTGTAIRVDISTAYSPWEAYRDAARHIMLSTRSLAIMAGPKLRTDHVRDPYRSWGRQGKWGSAPSWVPSWDHCFHPGQSWTTERLSEDNATTITLGWLVGCSASNSMELEIEHPASNPNILRLRGLRLDQAHILQETTTSMATGMQFLTPTVYFGKENTLRREYTYCRSKWALYGRIPFSRYLFQSWRSGRRRPGILRLWETALETTTRTPEALASAALMVTTGGYASQGIPINEAAYRLYCAYLYHHYHYGKRRRCHLTDERRSEVEQFLAPFAAEKSYDVSALSSSGPLVELDHFDEELEASLLLQSSMNRTNLRRFFITKKGRLGVGPSAMREGDEICVLFGGGVPFVLRRIEGRESAWAMVGEAYVEGYMNGEAISEAKESCREPEWFDIH